MLKLSLLVAVCLLGLSSGETLFKRVQQSAMQNMLDIGEGGCRSDDLCGPFGMCMEDKGGAPYCSCFPPYSGAKCDEVCSLDQCMSNFMMGLQSAFPGPPSGPQPTRHLRRLFEIKRRLSSMQKRQMPSMEDYLAQFQANCRSEAADFVKCVNEAFKNKSYCSGCDKDKQLTFRQQAKSKDAAADLLCDMGGNCTNQETAVCTNQVIQILTNLADPSAMTLQGLQSARTCVSKLISGELPLDGCTRYSEFKDMSMIFLIDMYKSQLGGCNMILIGQKCGSSEEEMAAVCSQPEEWVDTMIKCSQDEAAKMGAQCAEEMKSFGLLKSFLKKQCEMEAQAEKDQQACKSSKRSNKLADVIRALSPKQEKTLLKELLHELADE